MEPTATETPTLLGLATLMKRAFDQVDLGPLAEQLRARIRSNPADAEARMDLCTLLQLEFKPEEALPLLAEALEIQQRYRLPAKGPAAIRLLALMTPGDIAANTPLEFLVEGSDIALELLYLSPDRPLPDPLPEHDVMFVAVGEADDHRPLLDALAERVPTWPRPVLNPPVGILLTSREHAYECLRSLPGVAIPQTVRAARAILERVSQRTQPLSSLLEDGSLPVIIRPIESHAGRGLEKLDSLAALADYLQRMPEGEFYLSNFVDYRGKDGQFRKFRIVLIQGRAFAVHLGVSTHWIIHYLNAGMDQDVVKRAEESLFMSRFDERFARRHDAALRGITDRLGLDYLVIDCAETPAGDLLIFEVDTGAVVHAMDPVELFPYKLPQMHRIFAAFREMLLRTRERGARA